MWRHRGRRWLCDGTDASTSQEMPRIPIQNFRLLWIQNSSFQNWETIYFYCLTQVLFVYFCFLFYFVSAALIQLHWTVIKEQDWFLFLILCSKAWINNNWQLYSHICLNHVYSWLWQQHNWTLAQGSLRAEPRFWDVYIAHLLQITINIPWGSFQHWVFNVVLQLSQDHSSYTQLTKLIIYELFQLSGVRLPEFSHWSNRAFKIPLKTSLDCRPSELMF